MAESEPKITHWKIKKNPLEKREHVSLRKNQFRSSHIIIIEDRNASLHVAIMLQASLHVAIILQYILLYSHLYSSLKITPRWQGTASLFSTAAALLPLQQMFPARFVSCKVSFDFWGQKHYHEIFLALWLFAKNKVYKTVLHLHYTKLVLKIHCSQ